MASRIVLVCLLMARAAAALANPAGPSSGGDAPFELAAMGCSQAHCDAELSDQAALPAPGPGATIVKRDEQAAGSNYAVGCSSNGERVACSFGGVPSRGPYLVVYDADGNRLWHSDELGITAFTSAPAVGEDGGVIAADAHQVIRFDPDGGEIWRYRLPFRSGLPISPVVTERGHAAFATTSGLIGSVDTRSGAGRVFVLDVPIVTATGDSVPGRWVTRNTPSARSLADRERIYVTTEFEPDDDGPCIGKPARLYAIDIPADGPLDVAWSVDVGGRAGASPTVSGDTIYFDADRLDAAGPGGLSVGACDGTDEPHFFAVRDRGDHGEFVYKHPLTNPALPPSGEAGAVASAALDPRGGLWLFALGSPSLVWLSGTPSEDHLSRDGFPTADVLGELDFGTALSGLAPSSVITIADGPEGPVGMMTATGLSLGGGDGLVETRWVQFPLGKDGTSDLQLLNNVALDGGIGGWSAAQSAVVLDAQGRSRVFLSTFANGLVVIGEE